MPSNPHRVSASNSFTADQVRALLELHSVVLRGGDARQIASSKPMVGVAQKFNRMRAAYKAELRCVQ